MSGPPSSPLPSTPTATPLSTPRKTPSKGGRKAANPHLSSDERRRERVLKNRESAMKSLQKKKRYTEGLEARALALSQRNALLKEKIRRLLDRIPATSAAAEYLATLPPLPPGLLPAPQAPPRYAPGMQGYSHPIQALTSPPPRTTAPPPMMNSAPAPAPAQGLYMAPAPAGYDMLPASAPGYAVSSQPPLASGMTHLKLSPSPAGLAGGMVGGNVGGEAVQHPVPVKAELGAPGLIEDGLEDVFEDLGDGEDLGSLLGLMPGADAFV